MKKALSLVAAMFMFCGILMVGAPSRAQAANDANHDTLAMALAAMLGLEATSSDAAFAALVAVGIEPDGGWVPGATVTTDVMNQVNAAVTAAVNAGRITDVTADSLAMYRGDIVSAALASTRPTRERPAASGSTPN